MTQRLQTSDIKTRLFGNEMSPLSGKVLGFSKNEMRAPFVRLCTASMLFGCLCLACWPLARATITITITDDQHCFSMPCLFVLISHHFKSLKKEQTKNKLRVKQPEI